MNTIKPFRFGVAVLTANSAKEWREKAQKIESLGFDTLLVWDHFDSDFAPLLALTAAATATTTLRLGTLVLAIDFRHPAVLAKEAATLDFLSDGRLELGIGAGWKHEEYEQAGIPFYPADERVQRLAESVRILKQLFAAEPLTFHGTHYTVQQLRGKPTTKQQPHPPIMIGGARRKMLGLAAREADIVALATKVYPDGRHNFIDSTSSYIAKKVQFVRECAGDNVANIEFHIHVGGVIITEKRERQAEVLGPTVGLTGAQLLDCVQALVGTEEQIIEDLLQRREQYNISYITISENFIDAFAPILHRLRDK